jgi:hypothetical protein
MKTVSAFQTSDGELFTDESDAERHQELLNNRAVIEEFLESDFNPYRAMAHRAIARSTVINWSLWNNKRK